jgi:hypothetical protein
VKYIFGSHDGTHTFYNYMPTFASLQGSRRRHVAGLYFNFTDHISMLALLPPFRLSCTPVAAQREVNKQQYNSRC